MKLPIFLVPTLSAGVLLCACGKQPSKPASPVAEPPSAASTPAAPAVAEAPATVEADQLLQAFGSAGPEEKSRAGKAAQAIRADNYPAAHEILELLLKEGHLTPEQKELVTGFVAQLQKLKLDNR